MTKKSISNHLKYILKEEKIHSEDGSIEIIAKAAHGSMRDALSILDQAISYSGDKISTKKILEMLGTIDNTFLTLILNALAENNGKKVMELSKEMNEKSISFELALEELARLIYTISTHQIIPENIEQSEKNDGLKKLSLLFSPESLQLNYQIAINGRKDLHLAPDPVTGFNMTLLRMLAFYPSIQNNNELKSKKKVESKLDLLVIEKEDDILNNNKKEFDGDWVKLVSKLKIGIAKSLAQECSLESYENNIFNLNLNENLQHLNQNGYSEKLEEALINHFNKKIKINIKIGNNLKTPSLQKKMENAKLMKSTESAIMEDNLVKELIDDFGAEVITSSIKPTKKKEN